jgi:hypothetical protein
MKIVAHCFADNSSISPSPLKIDFKGFNVSLFPVDQNLTLQASKILSEEELVQFSKKVSHDTENVETAEDQLEEKLRPYKIILTEVAQLFEGLFALMYNSVPPHFDTSKTFVNLYAETEAERTFLDGGSVTRGAGYVIMPDRKYYNIDNSLFDLIAPSINHLPAFSFYSQALKSLNNNDNEIAFFLFFRIIDGYFSFGAKDVRKELLKKETELKNYVPYEPKLINSLSAILTEMGLPTESKNNFKGLIADIVNVRHKLTHFSSTKAKAHHTASIKLELATVNSYLCQCCFNLLRNKIAQVCV